MAEIRIGGLDLSITSTGFARTDGTTGLVVTKQTDGDRRITIIRDALMEAVGDAQAVVLERAPATLKGYAGEPLQQLQGAVRAALMDRGIPYAVVPPSTLKLFATGHGNSPKSELAVAAYKRAGVEFERDKGGDQCDAWWLRMAGLSKWAMIPFVLPKTQTDALDKVVWPEPKAETLEDAFSAVYRRGSEVPAAGFDPWA
jgi:Holliday junction resolvasome RuvABC endonuclease subunit